MPFFQRESKHPIAGVAQSFIGHELRTSVHDVLTFIVTRAVLGTHSIAIVLQHFSQLYSALLGATQKYLGQVLVP